MKKRYLISLVFMAVATQHLWAQLSATVHFTNPTCLASGSAYVVATGGSNYTYKWSTGATTDSVSRLVAATYTVTVYSTGGSTNWDSVYLETFDSTVQTWSTNISTGANGNAFNYWDISDSCIGNEAIGACVDNTYSPASGSNKCLYITAQPNSYGLPQYAGARYDAGGLCAILSFCTNSNVAAQSPNISTNGVHNLVLSFQYTAGGAGLNDNASLLYSINGGTSFTILDNSLKSNNNANCNADGDVEGTWAYKSYVLPSTCNNISNFVIRFNWTNDGNADPNATDPSIAVDNVTLRDSTPGNGIDSVVKTFTLTNPPLPSVSTTSMVIANSTCNQNNGSVTGITPTGGLAPYHLQWKNSGGTVLDTLNNLSGVDSGLYTFIVTDANGCVVDTNIAITTTPGALVPVISAPRDTLCVGDSVSICPTPQNYIHYVWSNGATTTCITSGPGNYNLTVTDAANCVTTANTFTLDSFSPITPVITGSGGDMVVSGGGAAWQWYYEGQAIPGATGNFFVTDSTGNYTVTTIDSHNCRYNSAPFFFSSLGISGVGESMLINLFPNPSNTGNLHLQVGQKLVGASCMVFDADGRMVFKTEIKNQDSEFELRIASGIYIVQVFSADTKCTFKLVKL